jgi:hypothetical protein
MESMLESQATGYPTVSALRLDAGTTCSEFP